MKAQKLLFRFLIFALSCSVIAYIIIQMVSGISEDVETEYAELSTVETTLQTTGYIFRNEKLIETDAPGVINYVVKESEKISANELIATISPSNNYLSTQKQISEIDEKINILQKSSLETSYLTSNITKIDDRIFSYLNQIKSKLESNDLKNISSIKNSFLINCNKRYLVTNNKTDFDVQISSLIEKRNQLAQSGNENTQSVFSGQSGYFSTILDGFENTYSVDLLKGMTVDSFQSLIQSQPQTYSENTLGKVICDFDWYTVCIVSEEEAEGLLENHSYVISYLYSSGERFNALLSEKITQTDSDKVVLVFKIDKVFAGFDYSRNQPIRIVKDNYNGIIVPKSAVRMTDDGIGVYVLEGSTVKFKLIDIIKSDDSNFVSTYFNPDDIEKRVYLTKFDKIIVSGKDLEKGRIIG